jgi:poly-gamma-glutamate capsule biosynthesis protein CapA/YwtB (metallophosphatase superfamily)
MDHEPQLSIGIASGRNPHTKAGTDWPPGWAREMKIALVGDVMLGRGVNDVLQHAPPHYPWGDTIRVLHEADFRVANLECAVSDRGEPWPDKMFHFRSDAKNIAVLKAARIDAVSLANNHSLDFGIEALIDTVSILDSNGIAHAGAGMNRPAAFAHAISTVGRVKIGLISFTDNEPDWEARESGCGIAYVPVDLDDSRAQALLQSIRAAKREVDILIVAAHWGPNWGYTPPPSQVTFGHRMIDFGADIVFGHSGHVFRGVDKYRGRTLIYCAGNFVDDYAVDEDERNDESFVFVIEIGTDGKSRRMLLYPAVIDECRVQLAAPPRAQAIASKMARLSVAFGTDSRWNAGQQRLEISFE